MPRLARIAWVLTIVYWCGLYALTHTPITVPVVVPVTDKTAHFVAYFILASALFLSMRLSRGRSAARNAVRVLGLMLVYGAFDELTQIPVNRSCEMADWYADIAGSAVAVVLMTLFFRD